MYAQFLPIYVRSWYLMAHLLIPLHRSMLPGRMPGEQEKYELVSPAKPNLLSRATSAIVSPVASVGSAIVSPVASVGQQVGSLGTTVVQGARSGVDIFTGSSKSKKIRVAATAYKAATRWQAAYRGRAARRYVEALRKQQDAWPAAFLNMLVKMVTFGGACSRSGCAGRRHDPDTDRPILVR